MIIRRERSEDYQQIYNLIRIAFESAPHSDGEEHELVERLRMGKGYISDLSLVAIIDDSIVGHIMFTKAKAGCTDVLALAPVTVLPENQNKGIGSALIREGHRLARKFGYGYSVVLGDPKYYSKFGYIPAEAYGITSPFEDIPEGYFMAYKIHDEAPKACGMMVYAEEFGIN